MDIIPPRIRSWLYSVSTAICAILGVYGILDNSKAAAWIALIAALLGTGTATAYRPTGRRNHNSDT